MHLDGLYAAAAGAGFGAVSLFSQSPTPDALGWVAQLGPAAGAAVVAYVAFRYVGKRDDDAKSAMDRQERQAAEDRAAVAKLFDRVEGMGKENRGAMEKVVDRMEKMIRENAQVHSNGLAQVSESIKLVVGTVTMFQKDVTEVKRDVAVLAKLAGLRPDDAPDDPPDPSRSDSKQVRIPKRLPKHEGGG